MLILLKNINQLAKSTRVTYLLISINILIFIAMLFAGAGLWHYVNNVQLAWGANFSPATQDGEWWRLGSAIFLHFSILHLALNMWSLWDAGQLVERMYGHTRFTCVYLFSGLLGNLTSLVMQGNSALSGGASGAIFGIFGALLVYLWVNRKTVLLHEFRWLFWGGLAFASATIILGFIIPGIDNSAHIGGFISGVLIGIVLLPYTDTKNPLSLKPKWLYSNRLIAAGTLTLITSLLIYAIPAPKYKWGDELFLRKQIDAFLAQDQEVNRSWLEIMQASKLKDVTSSSLANQIDSNIVNRYEESFEKLSQLPTNPALPSAAKLANLLQYTQERKNQSKLLAEKLRNQ